VKDPAAKAPESFGALREDRLQVVLSVTNITRTQVTHREEDLAPPEEREQWTLPQSIWRPRLKEADAHAFFDTDAVSCAPGGGGNKRGVGVAGGRMWGGHNSRATANISQGP
jgi:hypothetical protein